MSDLLEISDGNGIFYNQTKKYENTFYFIFITFKSTYSSFSRVRRKLQHSNIPN